VGAQHDQDVIPGSFNFEPSALAIDLFHYLRFLILKTGSQASITMGWSSICKIRDGPCGIYPIARTKRG